jgi:asparagine synthase (glutamine-hydrolysing)
MCGIAGIIGIGNEKSTSMINAMVDAIAHRGPDAKAIYVDNSVAFGHTRLSILDLSNGANQPFTDVSGDYVIVFNGEIYNYKEVKAKLDYNWRTTSDTEVILAAFIQWGSDCLKHLNGMFAFTIWNKKSESLFIARDRIGVKPFYYYQSEGTLLFGSELRSMLATGMIERKVDEDALYQYFANMAVKTPYTMIKGIFQLCPGEYAVFNKGVLKKSVYWSMADAGIYPQSKLSYKETVKKTRTLFEDSIKSRMVADVKVGAFLSGGIDSSAAVALMSSKSDVPVETFSIVFDDKDFDESQYSRLIAEKYKTKHTEFKLDPNDLLKELPDFIKNMDSPTVDGINTYLVSKLVAATGIKVVLTGIGGDELFVGYRNFRRWKKFNKFKYAIKNPLSRLIILLLNKLISHRAIAKIKDFQDIKGDGINPFYTNSRSIFLKEEINKLFLNPKYKKTKAWLDLDDEKISRMPLYSQYTVAELTNYTLDVLLKDTDQMSMAWALEVREPFFDYQLIEFLLTVPDDYKFESNTPKHLLVDAMGDLLPGEIVHRPKKGFAFPWDKWMRNELKSYCEEAIQKLSGRGIFNQENLIGLWNRFLANDKAITWMHIWSFVVLEKWMEQNGIKN